MCVVFKSRGSFINHLASFRYAFQVCATYFLSMDQMNKLNTASLCYCKVITWVLSGYLFQKGSHLCFRVQEKSRRNLSGVCTTLDAATVVHWDVLLLCHPASRVWASAWCHSEKIQILSMWLISLVQFNQLRTVRWKILSEVPSTRGNTRGCI